MNNDDSDNDAPQVELPPATYLAEESDDDDDADAANRDGFSTYATTYRAGYDYQVITGDGVEAGSSDEDDEEDEDEDEDAFFVEDRRGMTETKGEVYKLAHRWCREDKWVKLSVQPVTDSRLSPLFAFLVAEVEAGRLQSLREYAASMTADPRERPLVLGKLSSLKAAEGHKVAAGNFGDVGVFNWSGQSEVGLSVGFCRRVLASRRVFVKRQVKSPQFIAEVAVLATASDCALPTPRLLAVHEDAKTHMTTTVMELSRGEPAHHFFLNEQRPLAVKLRCAALFAFALQCCHAPHIAHSDVALKNFMTDGESCFEIVDFGLALVGRLPGALPYLHKQLAILQAAPETLENREVSPATDMWQFGWMLHDLFAGPHASGSARFLYQAFAPLLPRADVVGAARHEAMSQFIEAVKTVRPRAPEDEGKYPAAVHQLVLRLLDPDPLRRATSADAIRALAALMPDEGERDAAALLADCGSTYIAESRLRGTPFSVWFSNRASQTSLMENLEGIKAGSVTTLDLRGLALGGDYLEMLAEAVRGSNSMQRLFLDPLEQAVVTLWLNDTARSARVLGIKNAAKIDLRGQGLSEITSIVDALKSNSTVTELNLAHNNIRDGAAMGQAIVGNEVLELLDLSHNAISRAAGLARGLTRNRVLVEVNLSHNPVEDARAVGLQLRQREVHARLLMSGAVAGHAALWMNDTEASQRVLGHGETVDMSYSGLHVDALADVGKALSRNSAVKVLDLSGNKLETLEGLGVGLMANASLQVLRAGVNPLNAREALEEVGAGGPAALVELDLSGVSVDLAAADALVDLLVCCRATLKKAVVDFVPVAKLHVLGNVPPELLPVLGILSAEELDLSDVSMGDAEFVEVVDALREIRGVVRLKLADNRISDEGAAALGALLGEDYALVAVDVSKNAISDVGALALARGVRANSHIEVLMVDGNHLTRAGTSALNAAQAGHPLLRSVESVVSDPSSRLDRLRKQRDHMARELAYRRRAPRSGERAVELLREIRAREEHDALWTATAANPWVSNKAPSPSAQELQRSKVLDKALQQRRMKQQQIITLWLVGRPGSGVSTFVDQVVRSFGGTVAGAREPQCHVKQVRRLTLQWARELAIAADEDLVDNVAMLQELRQLTAESVEAVAGGADPEIFTRLIDFVQDPGMQKAAQGFEQVLVRALGDLLRPQHLGKMGAWAFTPDVCAASYASHGKVPSFVRVIELDNTLMRLIDVGPQPEARKWAHFMEDVNGLIMITSLVDYAGKWMPVEGEEEEMAQMWMYEELLNSRWVRDASKWLLVNMPDARCSEQPSDEAMEELMQKIRETNRNPSQEVLGDKVVATDSAHVQHVFRSIRDNVLRMTLKSAGLLG